MKKIPFNIPHFSGDELVYIKKCIDTKKISGDGLFTFMCQNKWSELFNFKHCLLTSSCTDALEMTAILADIQPGDEVIVPSFTFTSTALAFILRGAKIIFIDSYGNNPNMDHTKIEELITPRTRAIVPVHYAGVSCQMDSICEIAKIHELYVIEDAAHSVDSYFNENPLGSLGHFGAFSFHETKNLTSGEGGMLCINDVKFSKRAEIIREKGTNRSSFFRGEVNKYGWVDIGSSFLMSDLNAAYLYGQIENIQTIQHRRVLIWNMYNEGLKHLEQLELISLPTIPKYASLNGHLFYLICQDLETRQALIEHLKNNGIQAVFHYQSLHKSEFYKNEHGLRPLKNADKFSDQLLRLPLYYDLSDDDVYFIIEQVYIFFKIQKSTRNNCSPNLQNKL